MDGRELGDLTVLGLYGGVGSGKSTVAALFQELGALVIDADRIAHECLDQQAVREEVVAEFGSSVLGPTGRVERSRLAKVVFLDEERRARLNQIIHPEVRRRIRDRLEVCAREESGRLVVLDVPLLLESELETLCDRRLFVDAPLEIRSRRVQAIRGWKPGELERREKTQKSIEEKRAIADYMIENEGTLALLRARVRAIFQELSP